MNPLRTRTAAAAAILSAAAALARPAAPEDDFGAVRTTFLEGINGGRAEKGLPPFRLVPLLSRIAQDRAAAVVREGAHPEESAHADSAAASSKGYEARALSEVLVQADGDVETVLRGAALDTAFAEEVRRSDLRDLGVGVSRLDDIPLYVFLFARAWPDFFADKTVELSNLETIRAALLARVNLERVAAGLQTVRPQPLLDETAWRHARDMLARSYYGHDSPEGTTALDRSKRAGYKPRYIGENIARGQYSPQEVMDGWMGSDLHREHILGNLFSETGSAVAIGKNANGYQVLWVQVFGRPRDLLPARRNRMESPGKT
ncbi:MAG: CAP domain-containing protein [Thermoanaerobaculia bacterium]